MKQHIKMKYPASDTTGFLLIQCSKCGDIRGMRAKLPITVYRCRKCGGRTLLDTYSRAYMRCECGRRSAYYTNCTDRLIEAECYQCGCPITMEMTKKGCYDTIRSE